MRHVSLNRAGTTYRPSHRTFYYHMRTHDSSDPTVLAAHICIRVGEHDPTIRFRHCATRCLGGRSCHPIVHPVPFYPYLYRGADCSFYTLVTLHPSPSSFLHDPLRHHASYCTYPSPITRHFPSLAQIDNRQSPLSSPFRASERASEHGFILFSVFVLVLTHPYLPMHPPVPVLFGIELFFVFALSIRFVYIALSFLLRLFLNLSLLLLTLRHDILFSRRFTAMHDSRLRAVITHCITAHAHALTTRSLHSPCFPSYILSTSYAQSTSNRTRSGPE